MLKYASLSETGNRKYNEDYFRISSISNRYCFVVCDGLGGHNYGDLAARIVANTFVDELYYADHLPDFLLNTFVKAQKNIELKQKLSNSKKDMKTTAVCMLTDEKNLYVGHVGDSRLYCFKKDGTYTRTLDHSIPQILVQSNTITEEEIRNHPNRNMLLKVIGDKWDEPLCEIADPVPIDDCFAFLLCSDGFWELINETEMLSTLKSSSTPQEWLDKMKNIVEQNGTSREMDNYTAITVFYENKEKGN